MSLNKPVWKLKNWINEKKLFNDALSLNLNAIDYLKKNPHKIDWKFLSANPNAIELLEANQDKIDWYWFSSNSAIFTYDYSKMKENCNIFKEELIAYVYHPSRIFKNVTEETDLDELLEC